MKLILIGSTGQLGGYLLKDLKLLGNVFAPPKNELNILRESSVINYFKLHADADYVINTAAYNRVNDANKRWDEAFKTNSIAVQVLARESAKNNIKFITISTDYVFDGRKKNPYLESDNPSPLQIYGSSKLSGEHLAFSENKYTIIIRTAGLFGGTGSKSKGGNFVLNRLSDSKKLLEIEVVNNQTSSVTYAGDLSVGIAQLIEKQVPSGTYHLTNEGFTSWANFTAKILNLTNSKTIVKAVNRDFSKEETKRPYYSVLENTRAKAHGIRLPNWEDGLLRYLSELSLLN